MKDRAGKRTASCPYICMLVFALLLANGASGQEGEKNSALSGQGLSGLYNRGEILKLEEVLSSFEPQSEHEKAAKLYYQAKISLKRADVAVHLKQLISDYPQTEYGQQGLLEMAKISLLERDYRQSLDYLLKIDTARLNRDYYLAAVYLKMNLYPEAIAAARRFVSASDDAVMKEIAYLNIVESYILNKQYSQALASLSRMRADNLIVNEGALVTFKEGYCLEREEKIPEAVNKYKLVITSYPYTEQSYRAEKRLYDLTIADRISASELTTAVPVPQRTESTIGSEDTSSNLPVRQPGTEYYYVQVNAFSGAKNAQNHSTHLKRSGFENIVITKIVRDQNLYVVAVGPYEARRDAVAAQMKLKDRLNLDSFIIRHQE